MILDQLAAWYTMLQNALMLILPGDIVLWLIELVILMIVLAVWRMAH